MFDRRYEITGVLEVLSPLHVGSGEVKEIGGIDGKPGSNDCPEVALIVRDFKDNPYLPATTIKGLLRRLGEESLTGEEVTELFGRIKNSETKTGNMGAILARGASLEKAPDVSRCPYVKAAGAELGPGVFVAVRTAIDPKSGTAAEHKLFFQEMVAPGAEFGLRLTLIADPDGGQRRLDALIKILAGLADERGMVCGRGQADGSGALRLCAASLKIEEKAIDPKDGLLKPEEKTKEFDLPKIAARTRECLQKGLSVLTESAGQTGAAPRPPLTWQQKFICDEPFISIDSSWKPPESKGDNEPKGPQLNYQHGANGKPLDLGSQIAGVLRARARWIMGLKALGLGVDPKRVDPSACDDKIARERVVKSRGDVERLDLTPVERLFGVSGFAGLLVIEKMHFSGGKPEDITSVKLDHFSGAPIDKALFTTRAVIGTKLELALELRDRGGVGKPRLAERALFKKLRADIHKKRSDAGTWIGQRLWLVQA